MANNKSDWLENLVINSIIGASTVLSTAAIPSTLYVALLNTTINDTWLPTDTGEVGTTGTNNYGRFKFPNTTSTAWTKATTGTVQNKATILFTTTTGASTAWGEIKAAAIVTTNTTTAGQTLYWGNLTAPVIVAQGNTVRFSTGTMVIGEL